MVFKQNRIYDTIYDNKKYYMIIYHFAASEEIIAKELKTPIKTIRKFFKDHCNSTQNYYGHIIFPTIEDAQKALDYLESLELANTLK